MYYKILVVESDRNLSALFERALCVARSRSMSAGLQVFCANSFTAAETQISFVGANEFDLISIGNNLPRSQNETKNPRTAKDLIVHLNNMNVSAKVVYYGVFDQMYEQISRLTVSSLPVVTRIRWQTDSQEEGKASVRQWADLCIDLVMRGK